jgi:GNAT superfamily N-acetyltransferase
LGKGYVQKSLEWFLVNNKRFLFHCFHDGKVVGYCGGFSPAFYGDGSSSGMLQHAFKEAIKGTLLKPWLLFHPEIFHYYPHIFRNLKKKVFSSNKKLSANVVQTPIEPTVGLVIIGVHPEYRGKGVFELLMKEFEVQALKQNRTQVNLTVNKDNIRAINAYKKAGWLIKKQEVNEVKMNKFL